MNGADRLCDTLLANGVDVCFANPGTSEMHFVAALDRKPQMRCVLGLFEGVVTAAADGYARMADRPAATLLHTGPGLANGLANLHNARRARTPMVNVVGDHASYHLALDAPLTSDIESLARSMSHWVGRIAGPDDVGARASEAYAAAITAPGVSTLILPADAAWGEVSVGPLAPVVLPARPRPDQRAMDRTVATLRSGARVALLLGDRAMRAGTLEFAGRIAAATGATLFTERAARSQRGAGRVAARPVPYNVDLAVATFAEFETVICIGRPAPVAFFAYPGKPGRIVAEGTEVIELAGPEHDLHALLEELCEAAGAAHASARTSPMTTRELALPTGVLDANAISAVVARTLPDEAIVCEESITSAGNLWALSPAMPRHDHLPLTGGSIGIGIPLSVGAAIACPGRKVLTLQADGSGMYTLQGLWTQARERLDVTTVIFSNRGYSILKGEMRNVGVNDFGRNARRMLDIDDPALDWCVLARGMGVEAARAETVGQFADLMAAATSRRGPFLIEAVM